jgi:hypothetical protein
MLFIFYVNNMAFSDLLEAIYYKMSRNISWVFILLTILYSCNKDNGLAFSADEITSTCNFDIGNNTIIFTQNAYNIRNDRARDDQGEDIAGIFNKGYITDFRTPDNSYKGKNSLSIQINRWINKSDTDLDSSGIWVEDVLRMPQFIKIFDPGLRLFAKNGSPTQKTDEISIQYFNNENEFWSSAFPGNYFNTPDYESLQPNGYFEIMRSQQINDDSVFVEGKFSVRLYNVISGNWKNDYLDIENGYFKGYYSRRLFRP